MKYIQHGETKPKIKIDLKNKKILDILSRNARLPNTVIARKTGMSRDAVGYRISTLEKSGLIQGYRTAADIGMLGYDAYHIFLQLRQPTKEAEQSLIEKFKRYSFVRAVLKFSGKYDFELAIVAKGVSEFDRILSTVLSDCSPYLQDYEILVITKTYKAGSFPPSFIRQKETQPKPTQKKDEHPKIDAVDIKILKIIGENARAPLYTVAEKAGLSADAANYRIKKMTSSGIIKGFIPVINYAGLGYSIYAVLLSIQPLTKEKEAMLSEFLRTNENMLWAVKTVGRFNVLFYLCTANPDDLHNTMIRLRNHFPENIKHYETLIAYEEYKYILVPECIDAEDTQEGRK